MHTFNTRIKHKIDFENQFLINNPILLNGEIAISIQNDGTELIKVGNGYSTYSELPFLFKGADWAINDSTDPAFIKNRPFYTERVYSVSKEILSYFPLEHTELNTVSGYIDEILVLEPMSYYAFIIRYLDENGTYENLFASNSNMAESETELYGNGYTLTLNTEENRTNIVVTFDNYSQQIFENVNITLFKMENIEYHHKIPEEYLPDMTADWSINEENESGYIKNRTHYVKQWEEYKYELTNLEFSTPANLDGVYIAYGKTETEPFNLNTVYPVEWPEYWVGCWAQEYEDGRIYLGNIGLVDGSADITEQMEPFCLLMDSEGNWECYGIVPENYTLNSLKIRQSFEEIKTLDRMYMPEGVVYQEDLGNIQAGVQSDWNENNSDSLAYIYNRPFGERIEHYDIVSAYDVELEDTGRTYDDQVLYKYEYVSDIGLYDHGQIYYLDINYGEVFLHLPISWDGDYYYGNRYLEDPDEYDDDGTDFLIRVHEREDDWMQIISFYTVNSEYRNFYIWQEEHIIDKLDNKFLHNEVFSKANWDENDSENPSYIENKPFYERSYWGEFWWDYRFEPEGEDSGLTYEGDPVYVFTGTYYGPEIEANTNYRVTAKDTDGYEIDYHDVWSWEYNGQYYIGNANMIGWTDANSPWHTFMLVLDYKNYEYKFYSWNDEPRQEIEVRKWTTEVKTIEDKYISNNFKINTPEASGLLVNETENGKEISIDENITFILDCGQALEI